jgi:hypothetical protein
MRLLLITSSMAQALLLGCSSVPASSPTPECPPSTTLVCSEAKCSPPRLLQLQCGDRLYAGAPVRGLVALVIGTLQNFEPALDWNRQVPLRFHAGSDLHKQTQVSLTLILSPDKCPPGSEPKPGKLSGCLDPSPSGRTLRPDAEGKYWWPDDVFDGTYLVLACGTFRYLDTLETTDCFTYSVRLGAVR